MPRASHWLSIFAILAAMLTFGCDAPESTSDDGDEQPRRKKRRKKRRSPAATSASADRPAALKPLPPVGPNVRTEPPTDLNAPIDVERTASGLASRVLKRGTGTRKPGLNDSVEVHYSGWTLDGKMFDSSVPRGKTSNFGVSKVIKGWTEGLMLMVEGERRRLWIPAELAYGLVPKRGSAPAGRLVFDLEVISIKFAPAVPADLETPPASARTTGSGLVYAVLRRGTSDTHPGPASKVEVHYSGWTQDGKMFDSSVTRGKSAVFGVDKVIAGWTEALQLMSPGDRFRMWIPGDLAYGDTPKRPGAPSGTLVFDVELITIR